MPRAAVTRSRRTVRLRTAKGTRRVPLPRPGVSQRPARLRRPPQLKEALTKAAEDRGQRFRRRLRRGIPIGSRKRIDASVHDLRTSARRLLAALEALEPFLGAKRRRRLSRRIEAVLDRSGSLRDLGVQLEMLPSVGLSTAESPLRGLKERLQDKHEQGARALHRRLRRRGMRGLRSELRRAMKRSRRSKASAARRTALQPARERFVRLRESRLAVNPAELDTVHRMRIELKKFRYIMEALRPAAAGMGEEDLESLHRLQTTMGDLHDLEVLSSTIARHVARREPEAAAQVAPILQELEGRHSAMLTSFLEAVDPILDSWGRVLSPGRSRPGKR